MKTRQPMEPWTFRDSPGLFNDVLSADLYDDDGRCAVEIIRNGMVACMRGEDRWEPSRIRVEARIVREHPLTRTDALVVCDAGSGFTKADVDRFCTNGPDRSQSSRHAGAAQKRIGRFSGFALRRDRNDYDKGFAILTRTSAAGMVTLVRITPNVLASGSAVPMLLEPDATELGSLQGHTGKFSCVVIPESVFRSNRELRDAVAWYLPRRADLCGDLQIGGEPFVPPPLVDQLVIAPDGTSIAAYLERATQGTRGGIHLVDTVTGFRVGFGPTLVSALPYPLARPDLSGDIFLPGLLAEQDTSRGGLRNAFLKSRAWKKLYDVLLAEVAKPARGLLEEDDLVGSSPLEQLIVGDIRDAFDQAFGKPTGPSIVTDDIEHPRQERKERADDGTDPKKRQPSDHPRAPRKPRGVRIRIGDENWQVAVTADDPLKFGEADSDSKILYVNRDYQLPRSRHARREHAKICILETVAAARHPFETKMALRYVAELLNRFLSQEAKER